MERKELEEDLVALIAGEVGGVALSLISNGIVISREAIVDSLEAKRKAVGNVIYKGLLRDVAEFARATKTRRGSRVKSLNFSENNQRCHSV